jgi:hypothetical protein
MTARVLSSSENMKYVPCGAHRLLAGDDVHLPPHLQICSINRDMQLLFQTRKSAYEEKTEKVESDLACWIELPWYSYIIHISGGNLTFSRLCNSHNFVHIFLSNVN